MRIANELVHTGRAIKYPILISFLGITLGIGLFFILLLPLRYAIVGLFVILAPSLALLTGRWKDFFLTFLVLGIPLQIKKTLYGYSLNHICGPGGIDITLADGALLALYIHWLYVIVTHKEERPFHLSKIDILVLIFIFINGLSLLNAFDLTLGIIDYIRIIKVALIYFYLANNIKRTKELKLVFLILLAGVFIHGGISIVQYLLGRPLGLVFFGEVGAFSGGEYYISQMTRPSGIMQGANTSALYLVAVIPFAFIAQFWMKNKGMKVFSFCIFIIGVFTLIITFSRGGWVGFFFSFPVLLFLSFKRGFISYRRHFHSFLLFGFVLFLVFLFLSPKIIDRVFHTPPLPIYARSFLNQVAFKMIGSHPITGVGLNNFAESAKAQNVIRDIPDPHNIFHFVSENPAVHNLYLLVSAEIGLFGLIIFLLILWALLKASWSSLQSDEPLISKLGCAIFCFILGFIVTEMFDFSYRLDQTFYLFWALAGLTVALTRMPETSSSKNGEVQSPSNEG